VVTPKNICRGQSLESLKSAKFNKYLIKTHKVYALINLSKKRMALLAAAALACATNANALDLVGDYQKALTYDPTYQTALAEFQANQASSSQALVAYMPTANLSNQRLQTDTTTRQTATITQPIFDLGNFATLRQASPRQGFAEATFLTKQQDLAMRLLKGANAIILANENLKLNASKMSALDQQALAAKRKLELGQGTVTDLRDIEVKAAQAKSQQLSYKTALSVALKQYAAITGSQPSAKDFVLEQKDRSLALKQPQEYVDLALQNSPALLASRFSERVAELELEKSTGSLLPTVSATYNKSQAGGTTNSYHGVLVNMPLQAGTYFGRKTVEANYLKAKEATRDTEEKTRVEVERLREQIETGLEALKIQKDAVAAAELSLEANQKSYEGGVRSAVDILNATQTVFQVKSDYVVALMRVAEDLLQLISHAKSTDSYLTTIEKFL
jgi:outer membrane protein, protease secretion system